MKKTLFIVAWLLMFISCQMEEKFSIAKDYPDQGVIIKGLVKNYDASSSTQIIRMGLNDFTKNAWNFSKSMIDGKGNFEFRFSIERPQEILLQLTTINTTLIAFPSDSIYIEIESRDDVQQELTYNAVSFFADRATTNNLIQEFLTSENEKNEGILQSDLEKESFKKYRLEKLKKDKRKLNDFIEKSTTKDPVFEYWATSHLSYKTADDLLTYPRLKNEENTSQYYTFLEQFEINDYNASICSAYGSFLDNYRLHLEKMLVDQSKKKEIQVKKTIETILTNTDGFAQDILMTQYFYNKMDAASDESLRPYYSVYYDSVSTKKYKQQLKEYHSILHGEEEVEINDRTTLIINKKVENILPAIAKRHKGKVIYVDMWGTWCIPCIKEMPMHKLLREKYKNKEIAFVYLGVNSQRKLWYKMIKNYEIDGDHFILTKKQFDYLDRLFYIDGIPHHFLMDKTGKVAIDLAPSPSQGEGKTLNNKLLKEINKLLNL